MTILPQIFSRVILSFFFLLNIAVAQDSLSIPGMEGMPNKNLTISYSIELKSDEPGKGIGETYNGGVKTVFISDDKAMVRLVSLMRMQSVFILPQIDDTNNAAVIVKESGKNKYKTYLSKRDWETYNRKYDSSTCILTTDSISILNYPCRKAIINLQDGRSITAYYTDSLRNSIFSKADPAFKCIPGIVLKYEYSYKKGTIAYTATNISTSYVSGDVFKIPAKGYAVRKFSFSTSENNDIAN